MSTPLNGTILLTGATGGIGTAIARRLAPDAQRLVLTGRRADVLNDLAAQLPNTDVVVADLADAGAARLLAETIGAIDLVVANAGLPGDGPLVSYDDDAIERVFDVNLTSPVLLTRAVLPGMLERRHGHLVYISSINGKLATISTALYASTKFGLRGFASALRQDLAGSGVGVSTIFPGFISDAGMWADAGLDLPPGMGTRRPDHVADAVVRAVRRNKAELDVAAFSQRLGGWLGGLAPDAIGSLTRRFGAQLAADLADAHLVHR